MHHGAADTLYRAGKKVMMETLKHYSLACLPEGIAGIFQGASPLREAVYLSNRKGFIKLAIQSGSGKLIR